MEHIDVIRLQIKGTIQHCYNAQGKINTYFTLTTNIDIPIILEQMTLRRSGNLQNLPKFVSKLKSKHFHSKFKVTRKIINQFALGREHDFKFVTQETQMIYKPLPP